MDAEKFKNSLIKKITDINKAKQGLNDVMPLTWKGRELQG